MHGVALGELLLEYLARVSRQGAVLEHALEDKKIEMLYKGSDWAEFSGADPEFLQVKGRRIPYSVFKNEPEITDQPDKLGAHLEEVLGRLWDLKYGS